MEITSGGGPRVLPEGGTHVARCVKIIDLGTQETEFEGKKGKAKKVQFSFELIGQTYLFDEGGEDEKEVPFIVHKEYTASIGAKANLAKDLASWLGKKLDPKVPFKPEVLLGKECQVVVLIETSKKSGEDYAKIGAIMAVPAKMKVDRAASNKVFLSLNPDEFDVEVYKELPTFLRDKIKAAPEFIALNVKVDDRKKKNDDQDDDEQQEKPSRNAKAQPQKKDRKKTPF